MQRVVVLSVVAVCFAVAVSPAAAETVGGGGSKATDCVTVFEIPGANKPAPPKTPKSVDCVDGDLTCDDDGLRNGECVFPLQLCVNSSSSVDCEADTANSVVVSHAIDDGTDPRFDTDFQALQLRADTLGLPSSAPNQCTLSSAVTVRLKGPDSNNVMRLNRKKLRVTTQGATAGGDARDVDNVKFTCRPEGDRIYLPINLYEGTFDRIRDQVFAQSCALSGCHDSESSEGGLILLAGAAYGNIVNVVPENTAAADDMLLRIAPGDENLSFLYRKITDDLEPGYGSAMPDGLPALDPSLVELIRKWIIGDGILGPAPENGWVEGTDQ